MGVGGTVERGTDFCGVPDCRRCCEYIHAGVPWARGASNTPGTLDEELLNVVRGPVVLFITLSGLFLALLILTNLDSPRYELIAGFDDQIRRAWLVVVIAEVAYLLYHLLDATMTWYIQSVGADDGDATGRQAAAAAEGALCRCWSIHWAF